MKHIITAHSPPLISPLLSWSILPAAWMSSAAVCRNTRSDLLFFRPPMPIRSINSHAAKNILNGDIYIFPKLDGLEGSCFVSDDGNLKCASAKKELSTEKDMQGFYHVMLSTPEIYDYLEAHPDHILYGIWLIPQNILTYKDSAWRKFYITDVYDAAHRRYLPYDEYKPLLDEYFLYYTPTIGTLQIKDGPSVDVLDFLQKTKANNNFLLSEYSTANAGIIIKNYKYAENCPNPAWVELTDYDEDQKIPTVEPLIEQKIVADCLTNDFLAEAYIKYGETLDRWNGLDMANCLFFIYRYFVNKQIWHIVHKYEEPIINFHILKKCVYKKAREYLRKNYY